jgi:hypothetical protein
MIEEKWRSGNEGRLDADGLRWWWETTPFLGWFRYDNRVLRTRGDQDGAAWVDDE